MALVKVPNLTPPPPQAKESTWKRWAERLAIAVASGAISVATANKLRSNAKANKHAQTIRDYRFAIGSPSEYSPNESRSVRSVGISGRGAYTLRNLAKDTTMGIGGVLGGLAGAATAPVTGPYGAGIGAAVGLGLGSELGEYIYGQGAYTVRSNTLNNQGSVLPEGVDVPSFIDLGDSTRIRHREYIKDIAAPTTPTAFSNTGYVINPGNTQLFPWLASIAANYQQYEIMGMVFYFKTTTSDYAATGALGTVVMATNYDVLENKYLTKVAMENSQYAVSAKPSRSQLHAIECDPGRTSEVIKYVRDSTSSTSVNQDNRFYDHGKFQIATSGLSSTTGTVIGELWVTYDIKFYKPELALATGLESGQKIGAAGSPNKTLVFGNTPTSLGPAIADPVGNTLTFLQPGTFLLTAYMVGTGLIDTTETTTLTTATPLWAVTSGTTMSNGYQLVCTAAGQTFTFDATGSLTYLGGDFRICQYSLV